MFGVFCYLNSLYKGAKYEEEDGVKSLYLDGSGAYATTPAVDFGTGTSFTIASWVKLQSPVQDASPIYADWSSGETKKFIIYAYLNEMLLFKVFTNQNRAEPNLGGG